MHKVSKKYLLQIEPKGPKSKRPCNDNLTDKMEALIRRAKHGKPWKGTHKCICGERSGNTDLFASGYTTNSLAAHYLRWHRDDVPFSEIEKLQRI